MPMPIPEEMNAAALDRFGGPEELHAEKLPVPKPGPHEVLIRLKTAGVGVWDPYVREGELDLGGKREFPKIIGNDCAGTVVAVGDGVTRFKVGDAVYAFAGSGCYAEYACLKDKEVAKVPSTLKLEEAGALGADGITALRGLEDHLHLRSGQTLLIFGASGGVGHLAVQLAKRLGAKVIAMASGEDGVQLVQRLGADQVLEGHQPGLDQRIRQLVPEGANAALVLVGGKNTDQALQCVKRGGRVAYPNGVEPEPECPRGVDCVAYDGIPSPDAFDRLNHLIGMAPFHVELYRIYPLKDAAQAHRELSKHHLGKLALSAS